MSNSITASILKFYGPSLPNRDDSGDAKQIIVGGTTRSRISSQCLKRAIRQTMDISDFRSSHLEDLVESILLKKFEGKDMKQEQIDKIGSTVCTLIGCDWDKRRRAPKKALPATQKLRDAPLSLLPAKKSRLLSTQL